MKRGKKRSPRKVSNHTLETLTHLLGWLTGFLGPLIILLLTKNDKVKKHAKVVLNWQLSFLIYCIIGCSVLFGGIFFVSYFLALVVGLLLVILGGISIMFSLIGAVKASEGKLWRYPFSIGFLR